MTHVGEPLVLRRVCSYEHPVVEAHVSHFMHLLLRGSEPGDHKLAGEGRISHGAG
jgi:hypothetical protein